MARIIYVKRVRISSRGVRLVGWLTTPQNAGLKLPAVLIIHGWGSSVVPSYLERAKAISRKGFVCLVVALRGHAGSSGTIAHVTRNEHLADACAAYDFLLNQKGVDRSRIGVFGTSYGGYLAMLLSSKRNVAWLALRAPALYRDEGFRFSTQLAIENLRDYRREYMHFSRNRALKALHAFDGDVLIVAGERDEDVPLQTIENVEAACSDKRRVTLRTIPRADHVLSKKSHRLAANRIITNWVADHR
jgi:dipeptidyl aminopeptidase/acylaminoacyl peptidase